MTLLLPVGDVALDEAEPDLACFANYLATVLFELEKLGWDLNVSEDRGEEGIGQIANIVEHADVLDKPGFGDLVQRGGRHIDGGGVVS